MIQQNNNVEQQQQQHHLIKEHLQPPEYISQFQLFEIICQWQSYINLFPVNSSSYSYGCFFTAFIPI